jgi:hypothetical protein
MFDGLIQMFSGIAETFVIAELFIKPKFFNKKGRSLATSPLFS